jgi:hypothetical protein
MVDLLDRMDRSFVTAVERAYVDEARRRTDTGLSPLAAHRAALSAAIYAADRTNGGLRYRALDAPTRSELEERLLRLWN